MKMIKVLNLLGLVLAVALAAVPAQAKIYWQNNEFRIDSNRPGWTGAVAKLNVGQGESRDHIIAFEVIQNDLATLLNILRNNPKNQTDVNRLATVTDALFQNGPSGELQAMQTARNNLLKDMVGKNTGNYQKGAQKLLSLLNSSSANVRVGNSALNTSIGYSIDAQFQPGLSTYTGKVSVNNGPIQLNKVSVLRLTDHDNAIVYIYQTSNTLPLGFVVNGIAGALNTAAPNGVQLSSTQLPTVTPSDPKKPYPVLVVDPANNTIPFLYQ